MWRPCPRARTARAHWQFEPRHQEIAAPEADRHEERADQIESGARPTIARRHLVGADVSPGARAQQAQRRRRREHVVIELERGQCEEPDDRQRPGPEHRLHAVDALSSHQRADVVDQSSDEQAGPRQQRRRKDLKVEPETGLVREPASGKQPNILVEHVAVDEAVLEAHVHVDEPRRGYGGDDGQSPRPSERQEPAAQVRRQRHEQQHGQAAQHEGDWSLRLHAERDRQVSQPLQARSVVERSDGKAGGAAEHEHGKQRVQDGVARQSEYTGAGGEHQTGDQPGITRDGHGAEPDGDRHQPERGQRRDEAGAELRVAGQAHRGALQLME